MQPARALAFDFNGTLSHDEPLLFAIYAELFAEHGRPLTEADYYGRLAGTRRRRSSRAGSAWRATSSRR